MKQAASNGVEVYALGNGCLCCSSAASDGFAAAVGEALKQREAGTPQPSAPLAISSLESGALHRILSRRRAGRQGRGTHTGQSMVSRIGASPLPVGGCQLLRERRTPCVNRRRPSGPGGIEYLIVETSGLSDPQQVSDPCLSPACPLPFFSKTAPFLAVPQLIAALDAEYGRLYRARLDGVRWAGVAERGELSAQGRRGVRVQLEHSACTPPALAALCPPRTRMRASTSDARTQLNDTVQACTPRRRQLLWRPRYLLNVGSTQVVTVVDADALLAELPQQVRGPAFRVRFHCLSSLRQRLSLRSCS